MSKELEALNLIRENLTNKTFRFDLVGCLDIIEQALIELEQLRERERDIYR